MPRVERQRGRARSQWLAYVTVAAVAAGVAFWVNRAPPSQRVAAGEAGHATSAAQVANAPAADPDASLAAGGLPASLDGSSPPRLPTDGHGRLARTRAVRDFFDYFLTTQNEIPATTLDTLVRRQIDAQLEGTPAADEARDVWRRYNDYLKALAQLPQTASATPAPGSKIDLDGLQLELDQRDALGTRLMGEWNAPFFGQESQQQHTDLARLRIASDPTLSDAQKAARLAALDAALPPEVRAAHERIRQQQAALDALNQAQAQAQKQGGSLDAMRAQLTQTLGPEAAERAVQMQQADNAWQARYADYASQRAQIEQQNLPAQERDAQIAQLRQQFFTRPGDALRAASLDRGRGAGS
nr:Lipase chaperone [Paraburkholderia busanensis]